MKSTYTYKFRPLYGTEDMIIEFFVLNKAQLIEDLILVFKEKGFEVTGSEDMWMVEETWYHIKSKTVKFTIADALYGYVFIFPTDKNEYIFDIDNILKNNPLFEKEDVDFDDYKLNKPKSMDEDSGNNDKSDISY